MEPIYIIADTQRAVSRDKIYVTQNDNVKLIVKIQQNGKDVPLTVDNTYTLTSLRRDGISVMSPTAGVLTGSNEIMFEVGTQALVIAGKVRASVQILSPSGRISTLSFEFNVVDDISTDFITSENEQTLIEMVLYEAPAIIQAAKDSVADSELAVANANDAVVEVGAVAAENKTRFLNAVATVALRDSTYPNPLNGDTVRVTGTSTTYRFSTGSGWVVTDEYNATAIDNVTAQLAEKANKTELNDIGVFQINKNKGLIDQTYLTDELKQQIAGTAPINAVVANAGITKEKLTRKLIADEQTTFLTKNKNIFNKNNVITGYALSTGAGTIFVSASYSVSDYIGVKANTAYFRNLPSNVVFFDASFVRISGISEGSGTFTTPANTVYIRTGLGNGYVPNLQIEEGTVATVKEDFSVNMDNLKLKEQNFNKKTVPLTVFKEVNVGKNKFDKSKATIDGSVSMVAGDVVVNTTSKVSEYIEVVPSRTYTRNMASNFAFYDEAKVFISTPYTSTDLTVTAPSNAKYMRVAVLNESLSIYQMEEGNKITSYERFGYKVDGLLYSDYTRNIKSPFPTKVKPETYRPGNFTHVFADVDKQGNIWTVAWENLIRKSTDGINFKTVIDAKPFLNSGETISLYGFLVADNGRIICATNQGRVLISNEEQTTLTQAFIFKGGFTQNTWGYDKKGRYILMGSYLVNKNATNPGREVYFSKDFGATWQLIFDKPISEMLEAANYHIHDVAFDPYSDMILISIGDGANRQIYYSYDYGQTFTAMFDETIYGVNNWAPIHPTSIVCFPDGIAFGSDELPEGISWWNRPKGIEKPVLKWEDVEYKIKFGKTTDTLIGTLAVKGDALTTPSGVYGVMPFRNHETTTEGHTRLFATGDGGKTWHEIFKEAEWSSSYKGFFNARLKLEGDGVYIYAAYSKLGDVHIWRAKMPNFIDS